MKPIVLFYLLLLSNGLFAQKMIEKDFASHFLKYGVGGSFVLYDVEKDTYVTSSIKNSKQRFVPASTFKIPNSIIALEMGLVEDSTTIMKWDGKIRANTNWNKDLTFVDAIRVSCVPCYQAIAQKVGVKTYRNYLKKLGFGKMVVTPQTLTTFWLGGKSGISAMEQVKFLTKLYQNKLPFSRQNMEIVKQMLVRERTPQLLLSGKTGWANKGELNPFWSEGLNVGWFVGWVIYENKPYIFATNVHTTTLNEEKFVASRIGITKSILAELGIFNP